MSDDKGQTETPSVSSGDGSSGKRGVETAAIQALDRWQQGLISQGYTAVTDESLWVFARYARLNRLKGYGPLTLDSTDYHIRIWTGDGERPILLLDLYGSKAFIPPGSQIAFWLTLKDFTREKSYLYYSLLLRMKKEVEPPVEYQPGRAAHKSLLLSDTESWPVAVRPFVDAWREGYQDCIDQIRQEHFSGVATNAVAAQLCSSVKQAFAKYLNLHVWSVEFDGSYVSLTFAGSHEEKFMKACGETRRTSLKK